MDLAHLQLAEQYRCGKQFDLAAEHFSKAIASLERPDADVVLKLARCQFKSGAFEACSITLARIPDLSESFTVWHAAAALLEQVISQYTPVAKRRVRLALLGSYTTTQFAPMLKLAAWRAGVLLDIRQSDYGQYRQEIIDSHSTLYSFDPDIVLLAMHAGELTLPWLSDNAEQDIAVEINRWRPLLETLSSRSRAAIAMHNFAIAPDDALGHLAAQLPGSRQAMTQQINARLANMSKVPLAIVDCDRIAAMFGKRRWFDDRYWHISKQAVALDALPLLARHTAAVVAAQLGLSRKCLVLDLDNTLWGGVVGEDGLAGIRIGQGSPEGESFLSLQRYLLDLKNKGVILAVSSKNNYADAVEPFEKHPDMLLRLSDIAMFIANWQPKPENIRQIASTLNIGLDAMVFLDDNPAEREIIRQLLPEVDVVPLGTEPASFVRSLADYLFFETTALTSEDSNKTRHYQSRARIAELQAGAESIGEFHRSLGMRAAVAPFDEMHLPRIVQLIGKTNQFNLTTRRHSMQSIRQFMANPHCVHLYLKLKDRFADHGLVSLIIANRLDNVMEIDTWLMSCRVIGRTVEAELLAHLSRRALELGCTVLRGIYVPTAKNAMVRDVFERFGFTRDGLLGCGTAVWNYDLAKQGPIVNGFIEPESSVEVLHAINAA